MSKVTDMEFIHIPVMLREVLESLQIRPDGIYVDGTVGGAGHSMEIAKRLTQDGRLYGFWNKGSRCCDYGI